MFLYSLAAGHEGDATKHLSGRVDGVLLRGYLESPKMMGHHTIIH